MRRKERNGREERRRKGKGREIMRRFIDSGICLLSIVRSFISTFNFQYFSSLFVRSLVVTFFFFLFLLSSRISFSSFIFPFDFYFPFLRRYLLHYYFLYKPIKYLLLHLIICFLPSLPPSPFLLLPGTLPSTFQDRLSGCLFGLVWFGLFLVCLIFYFASKMEQKRERKK